VTRVFTTLFSQYEPAIQAYVKAKTKKGRPASSVLRKMFIMTDLGGVGCPIKFPPVPILNRKKLARYDPAVRTPLGDAEGRQIAAYANGLVQLALSKPSWLDSRTMQLHYTFSLYTASLQRFYDEASKAKFRDFCAFCEKKNLAKLCPSFLQLRDTKKHQNNKLNPHTLCVTEHRVIKKFK
jgi:hypothetical protein